MKTKKVPIVRYKFNDGSIEDIPLAEITAKYANQFAAMMASDSPELKLLGRQKLKELSDQATAGVTHRLEQSLRASASRKLGPAEEKRIAKIYNYKVASGEKYGAVKALAAEYDVSTTTINAIVTKANGTK